MSALQKAFITYAERWGYSCGFFDGLTLASRLALRNTWRRLNPGSFDAGENLGAIMRIVDECRAKGAGAPDIETILKQVSR